MTHMRYVGIMTGVILAVSLSGCGQERLSYRIPQEHASPANIRDISKELSAISGVKRIEIQGNDTEKVIFLNCDSASFPIVSQKAAFLGLISQTKEQ